MATRRKPYQWTRHRASHRPLTLVDEANSFVVLDVNQHRGDREAIFNLVQAAPDLLRAARATLRVVGLTRRKSHAVKNLIKMLEDVIRRASRRTLPKRH